jgi:hypothetical protein
LHAIEHATRRRVAARDRRQRRSRRYANLLDLPRVVINIFDLASGEGEWLAAAGRRRCIRGPGSAIPLG